MNFQPSKTGKLQAVISFSVFVLQNYNWFPLISNDTHIFELLRNLKIEPSCLLLKPGRESLIAGSGFTVQKSAAKSQLLMAYPTGEQRVKHRSQIKQLHLQLGQGGNPWTPLASAMHTQASQICYADCASAMQPSPYSTTFFKSWFLCVMNNFYNFIFDILA